MVEYDGPVISDVKKRKGGKFLVSMGKSELVSIGHFQC